MTAPGAKNFKILPPKDIVSVLNTLQVQPPATADAIDKPSLESAHVYFQHLAEFSYDCDPLQVKMQLPALSQQLGFVCPEIYEDAVDLIAVFAFSRQLAMINLIEDFSLKDLWEPSTKRFRMLLSAMVNCCRYKENKLQLINSLKEELHSRDGERLEIVDKVDAMERQMQAAHEQHVRELGDMREAEAEVQRCSSEIEKLKRQKAQAEQVAEEAETTLKAKKERRKTQQEQTERVRKQVADLQSQIADSPEGIELDIAEREAQVREQRANVDELSNEKRSRLQREQVLSRLFEQISNVKEVMHKMRQSVDASTAAQDRKAAKQQRQEQQQQQLEAKRSEKADLQESVGQMEQALTSARAIHEQKAQELGQRRQRAYERHQELQAKRGEEQKQQHLLQMQRQELEAEVANAQRQYDAELQELLDRRAAVNKEAEDFVNEWDQLLGLEPAAFRGDGDTDGAALAEGQQFADPVKRSIMPQSPPQASAAIGGGAPLGGPQRATHGERRRLVAHMSSPSPARNLTANPLGFMSPTAPSR